MVCPSKWFIRNKIKKKGQEDIHGIIKDVIIKYYNKLSRLLDCSIHDTKPVHTLITVTDKVTCLTKKENKG